MSRAPAANSPRKAPSRWVGDLMSIVLGLALLGGVYLLVPDTSLSEVRKAGILTVCVPTSYPPLVTGNSDAPGIDIELLAAVAGRMDLRLRLQPIAAMGKDIDPRNWGVTRARCQLLGGGVVLSTLTRSFLDSTPPHLATGWSLIAKGPQTELKDARVGVYAGVSGLDRTGLSSYLRQAGAKIVLLRSADALTAALQTGEIDFGITESLLARQLAFDLAGGYAVRWLPGDMGRYPLGFGLWKGDLTLKRELVAVLGELEAEGLFDALAQKYHIAPISEAEPQ